jgi:cell division protein ZipA
VRRADLARAIAEESDPEQAPQAESAAAEAPPAPPREDPVELVGGFSAIDEQQTGPAPSADDAGGGRRRRGGGRRPAAEARPTADPQEQAPETLDWLDSLDEEQAPVAEEKPAPGRLPRGIEPEVFMLNVIARKPEGFRGEDILHILLACDLRFGDMNFFHRHEFAAGRGPIQFSVANMMQPGVFDIDQMAELATPGLVFFLTLPGPEDMMKAFDYMLETAQAVARNLDGDVLDESRSAITRQTVEHSRQRIRELERRMLARTSKA